MDEEAFILVTFIWKVQLESCVVGYRTLQVKYQKWEFLYILMGNLGQLKGILCSLMHDISKAHEPWCLHRLWCYPDSELNRICSWAILYRNGNIFLINSESIFCKIACIHKASFLYSCIKCLKLLCTFSCNCEVTTVLPSLYKAFVDNLDIFWTSLCDTTKWDY